MVKAAHMCVYVRVCLCEVHSSSGQCRGKYDALAVFSGATAIVRTVRGQWCALSAVNGVHCPQLMVCTVRS